MLFAIVQNTGAILARLDAPAITDVAQMPPAPDLCSWVEISQAQYDALLATFDNHHRPIYAWSGTDLLLIEYSQWFAIVRVSDRAVIALDSTNEGALPGTQEYVQITSQQWSEIARASRFDDGSPAWDCAADGTTTPRADGRYILMLSTPGGQTTFQVGDTVQVDAQLQQSDGTPITGPAGSVEAPLIRTVNGNSTRISQTLVNGAATLSRALPAGRYGIASGDPSVFRCAGTTEIEVAEVW